MSKPRLVLYFQELQNCPYYKNIFFSNFETFVTDSQNEFLNKVQNLSTDAAVICLCDDEEKQLDSFLNLYTLPVLIPVFICCRKLNPEFIRIAARRCIYRLFFCVIETGKIADLINNTIQTQSLKKYFEIFVPCNIKFSPHVTKLINEIVHTFPRRLKIQEYAERLGIKTCWLQKLCRQAFGVPLTVLLRRIRIYEALHLIKYTNLDNQDIAFQLNYTEESNMSRDFKKELGYCPNKARRLLIKHTPEQLLKHAIKY